jgi:hypothetical protein
MGNCCTSEGPPEHRTMAEMLIGVSREDIYLHYEFVKTLGEGSYGKVFLMKHKRGGGLRAVKQLNKGRISEAQLA